MLHFKKRIRMEIIKYDLNIFEVWFTVAQCYRANRRREKEFFS